MSWEQVTLKHVSYSRYFGFHRQYYSTTVPFLFIYAIAYAILVTDGAVK